MTTLTLWILMATSSAGSVAPGPSFNNQQDCEARVAAQTVEYRTQKGSIYTAPAYCRKVVFTRPMA
jgi:hypothetical protein